jgi:hypothetical protein
MVKLDEQSGNGFETEEWAGAGNAGMLDGNYCTSIAFDREYFSGIVKETTAWDIYNNEARKVDRELVKDWTASLNFLLVFVSTFLCSSLNYSRAHQAAIFSAVLAAFMVESKKLLEQDPTEVMLDVIIFHTNNLANETLLPYKRAQFTPSDSAVSINCLLFGGLSISLVAALASVIALQWVADFDASITRGGSSPQDRARRRQYRFASLKSWRMGELIAALPLLLYISVAMFFAGVIQWMLILSSTVGYVVISGAATALLFYFISTFLAVCFDSAPFNTPLSRWIYSGSRRLTILIRGFGTFSRMRGVPQPLSQSYDENQATYSREDRAVHAKTDLSYQAINWLARQISISEDSRQRLVLLIRELLTWPSGQLETPEFKQAPWIAILNFLAEKHRTSLQVRTQTRDEEKEFALLVNCSALPTIKAMISPPDGHYWNNPDEARYWSQYCTESGGISTSFYRLLRPSHVPVPLFLLTRDLPIPSLIMEDEMESAMRLSKWRNSNDKPLDVWKDVFAASNRFSDEFFNGCVYLLYSNSMVNWVNRANTEVNRLDIISMIAQRAMMGSISSVALVALIRAFEHALDPYKFRLFHKSPSCVQRPMSYGRNLQYRDEDVKQIHRSLTLLLARDLQGRSGPESLRRFPEVLAMLWLTPSAAYPHDWTSLELKYGLHCRVGDISEEILQDWVLHIDRSPQLAETLCLLIQTSSVHPEVGVHWVYSCARRSRKHLLSLLMHFDDIMCDERWSRSWVKILRVLCRTLRMDSLRTSIVKSRSNSSIMAFRNPFIRTIGYRVLEIDSINGDMPQYPLDQPGLMGETVQFLFSNMSNMDTQSAWQLRARFISNSLDRGSCDAIARLTKESFNDPDHLVRYQLKSRS